MWCPFLSRGITKRALVHIRPCKTRHTTSCGTRTVHCFELLLTVISSGQQLQVGLLLPGDANFYNTFWLIPVVSDSLNITFQICGYLIRGFQVRGEKLDNQNCPGYDLLQLLNSVREHSFMLALQFQRHSSSSVGPFNFKNSPLFPTGHNILYPCGE